MNMSLYPNAFLVILCLLAVTSAVFIILFFRKSKNSQSALDILYKKLRDEIRFSVQPMAEVPVGVEEITELATEVWRIEQRLIKITDKIPEAHKKGLDNSVQRLKRYLQKFDVEIEDYTGKKYNDGYNFDVLSREVDSSLEYPIIKETVEPTIICRGRIVKKAKVILASNQI